MDTTTRALVVLGTVSVLLAPVVNGIMLEAANTADRLFLQDADWQGDPPIPEDYQGPPPEGDPPEGEPPEDLPENGTGPAPQRRPQCDLQTRPTDAVWYHPNPSNETTVATTGRALDPNQQTFQVTDEHVGLGVRLVIEDLRGPLTARVYHADNPDQPVFEKQWQAAVGDDVDETSTITRPALASGEYVAELQFRQATYTSLEFVSVLASCQEGAG